MIRTISCAGLAAALAVAALAIPAGAAAPPWRVGVAPAPAATGTTTDQDVDCVTNSFCVQVGTGEQLDSHATMPVADVHRGSDVSAAALALPIDAQRPRTSAGLGAVDCLTVHYCVAVGSYDTYDGRSRALIETYRNGAWTASSVPGPTGYGLGLNDVACNVSSCVATGGYFNGFNDQPFLAVRDSHGVWTDPPLLDASYFFDLRSPVCPPVGSCYAQGYEYPGPGSTLQRARFMYPTASGWTGSYFPMPAGADEHTLTIGTMACPSAEFCTGVGVYQDSATGRNHLVAEQFARGRLSVRSISTPAATRTKHYLYATATSCGAVSAGVPCAAAATFSGAGESVYVEFAAGKWTARLAPLPAGADPRSVRVAAVSCTAAGACSAVGNYSVDGASRPLVEERTSAGWRPVQVKVPAGISRSTINLRTLSCVSSTCLAGGGLAGYPTAAQPRHLIYATN